MAIWQFDFHLVPRLEVGRRFGTIPLTISEDDYETVNWWAHNIHQFDEELSALLPKGHSSHPEIDIWGTEDGHRFDIVRENQRMAEIFGRLDVRDLSLSFANRVIEMARRNDLLIIAEGRHVLRPSVKELMSAVRRSPSFAFVRDPEGFLRRLSEDER